MTDKKKLERPLHIDMDFCEALERFAQTDKKEADELMEREKRKKKAGKAKPPGSQVDREHEG